MSQFNKNQRVKFCLSSQWSFVQALIQGFIWISCQPLRLLRRTSRKQLIQKKLRTRPCMNLQWPKFIFDSPNSTYSEKRPSKRGLWSHCPPKWGGRTTRIAICNTFQETLEYINSLASEPQFLGHGVVKFATLGSASDWSRDSWANSQKLTLEQPG